MGPQHVFYFDDGSFGNLIEDTTFSFLSQRLARRHHPSDLSLAAYNVGKELFYSSSSCQPGVACVWPGGGRGQRGDIAR